VGDSQPTVLGACLTNEVMSGAWIKKKDNGVSVQEKHTSGDLLTLRNIFHGIVVDATGLLFHGIVVDATGLLWPERPQLKQMWLEAALAVGGAGRHSTCGGGGRALGPVCWCGH
jgi:hypothetical protein